MDLAFAAGYIKNMLTIQKWRKYKQEFSPKRLPGGMYRCKRFTFRSLKEARRFCKEYSIYLATQKVCVGSPYETGNHVNPQTVSAFITQECHCAVFHSVERLSSTGMCAIFVSQVLPCHNKNVKYTIYRDTFNRLQLIIGQNKKVPQFWVFYSASLITEQELFNKIRDSLDNYYKCIRRRQGNESNTPMSDETLRRLGTQNRYTIATAAEMVSELLLTGTVTISQDNTRNNNSDSD